MCLSYVQLRNVALDARQQDSCVIFSVSQFVIESSTSPVGVVIWVREVPEVLEVLFCVEFYTNSTWNEIFVHATFPPFPNPKGSTALISTPVYTTIQGLSRILGNGWLIFDQKRRLTISSSSLFAPPPLWARLLKNGRGTDL